MTKLLMFIYALIMSILGIISMNPIGNGLGSFRFMDSFHNGIIFITY